MDRIGYCVLNMSNVSIATFAAGCFWGVEDAFRRIPGVLDVRVGYTGGTVQDPSYEMVCSGQTGHAEAVKITFDLDIVSYEHLLDAFWKMHDPTSVNRQGPDIGSQYRSAVFTHSPEQQEMAEDSKAKLDASHIYSLPAATEIGPAGPWYDAEEYHQRYFEKNGGGACHI